MEKLRCESVVEMRVGEMIGAVRALEEKRAGDSATPVLRHFRGRRERPCPARISEGSGTGPLETAPPPRNAFHLLFSARFEPAQHSRYLSHKFCH